MTIKKAFSGYVFFDFTIEHYCFTSFNGVVKGYALPSILFEECSIYSNKSSVLAEFSVSDRTGFSTFLRFFPLDYKTLEEFYDLEITFLNK